MRAWSRYVGTASRRPAIAAAARATGRGLARTAGTAHRRAGPARWSGAPRSGSARPRTSIGGRCGSPARAWARLGQLVRIQRLDHRQVRLVRLDLAQQGIHPGVAKLVVVLVDADRGREDRVVTEQALEAGLDEVVQRLVERSGRAVAPGRVSSGYTGGRESVTSSSGGRALRRSRLVRAVPGGRAGGSGADGDRGSGRSGLGERRPTASSAVSMSSAPIP